MQKAAPSFGRVMTMVLFALSCFGLLMFLWLSFGGSIPLQPKGYRFSVAVPEATQLALQADVRVAGVSVGKVVDKRLDPAGNRTLAVVQLDGQFAPLHKDARATLRQKTLLGETYLELTPGHKSAGDVPDGGELSPTHVVPTVQIDEIFNALDPRTRRAFRTWQASLAEAVRGNGRNLNDVLGNLPGFAANADDVLNVLDVEQVAVSRLFRDTGTVFTALGRDRGRLRSLVTGSAGVFRQTAAENRALAQSFQIFPTFLDESKATLARLQTFARDTDPLVRELRPVAHDLVPTLRDVHALAPDLRRLFVHLGPLVDASRQGLPALHDVLNGATPLLSQLGPFLSQLNPILQYLELNQHLVSDFISFGGAGLASTTVSSSGGIGHYLRQFGPVGAESLGVYPNRDAANRSDPYLPPLALVSGDANRYLDPDPAWNCDNAGGVHGPIESGPDKGPACYLGTLPSFHGGTGRFPHVTANSYAAPSRR